MKNYITDLIGEIAALFLIVWAGEALYNYFAPMFSLPILTYWQFFGLYILLNILIKPGKGLNRISQKIDSLKN